MEKLLEKTQSRCVYYDNYSLVLFSFRSGEPSSGLLRLLGIRQCFSKDDRGEITVDHLEWPRKEEEGDCRAQFPTQIEQWARLEAKSPTTEQELCTDALEQPTGAEGQTVFALLSAGARAALWLCGHSSDK